MADDIEEPITIAVPVSKKLKLDKPPDSCVKSAYHPSGLKFLNTKLWKQLQREKMKSDKELLELCSDNVLPDLEGKYDHSVALTVIKDVINQ